MPAASGDPFAGRTSTGAADRLVGMGQDAGFFDPSGTKMRAMRRRQAMRGARNRRRRGEVTSRLAGLDPFQQRAALFDLDRDVSGRTADFLTEADLNESMGNRDYFRDLFGGQLGFERQRQLDREAYDRSKPRFGDILGGIAGQAAGAFMGGLGGGMGGGKRQV